MKKLSIRRRWQLGISAAGLSAVVTVFCIWLHNHTNHSAFGLAAAVLSVLLYTGVCLRFVPRWLAFWDRAGADPLPDPAEPPRMGLRIFLTLLVLDGLVLALTALLRSLLGYGSSMDFWRCLDSGSYLTIAEQGYLAEGDWDRIVQLVFLPGYPLLVRLVNVLTRNVLAAGLLTSALCFAGAGAMCYRLLRLDYSHTDTMRALKFFLLLPGWFFYVSPMSEGLFLLCCCGCLYLCRRDHWFLGCLLGAYASFTRSLGLTLVVPLFFEAVRLTVREGKRRLRCFPALLLILCGFGGYLLLNYRLTGDPLRFLYYQKTHWGQELGWFFNTAAYQTEYLLNSLPEQAAMFWGLWLPNLLASFGALLIWLTAAPRLRPSLLGWGIIYFAVAIGATWLLSAPRYLLVLLPVPLGLAALSRRKTVNTALTALCAVSGFAYYLAFLCRWQVW